MIGIEKTMLDAETVIDLTTLARVKSMIGGNLSTTYDTLLTAWISAISKRAMMEILKRGLKSQSRSEYFDVDPGQDEVWLLGCPIDTTKTITVVNNNDTPRVWTDTGDVVSSDYIICDPARAYKGVLYFETVLTSGVNVLKVTYTGGMAADAAAFIAAFPDISDAIDRQLKYMWVNRDLVGIQSQGIAGASFTFYRPVNWLPDVRAVLENHARGL